MDRQGKKTIRGILIDPYERKISEVEVDGSLQSLYDAIGCQYVERIGVGGGNDIWLDEEGMITRGKPVFRIGGRPLAGRGLILGIRPDGNTIRTDLPLELVQAKIEWTDLQSSGSLTEPTQTEPTDEQRAMGFSFVINNGEPILEPYAPPQSPE